MANPSSLVFTPRPQPYRIDLSGVESLEDLKAKLPSLAANTDIMFQILFEDLKRLSVLVQALVPATTPSGVPIVTPAKTVFGPPGLDGLDGEEGLPGTPGAVGARGPQGTVGAPGLDGEPGEDGLQGVPGAVGAAGAAGAIGPQGHIGPPGQDAEDIDALYPLEYSVLPVAKGGTGQTTLAPVSGVLSANVLAPVNVSSIITIGTVASPVTTPGVVLGMAAAASAAHFAQRINNTDATGYSTLWMGAGNDGFIRGGNSAGAFTNQLVFLTSGATDCGFVVNNAMAFLVHGIDGTGNTEIINNLTVDKTLACAYSKNFSWNARTDSTVYQADTDGFVVAYSVGGAGTSAIAVATDASNPPTTVRINSSGTIGTNSAVCCPVKNGDYYKVVGSPSVTGTYWWVPLGTAG